MDHPRFEQSEGLKSKIPVSKIPVRATRPPSKLPVPISSKENQSKKYQTQSDVKNALSKAQLKPANAFLASRAKKTLPSQKARPPVANTAKETKSNFKQAEQKSKAFENVASKRQQNTYKTVPSASTSREMFLSPHNARLKNQGYPNAAAVSKYPAISGLQSKTHSKKASDQSMNKKPLSTGIVSENRRLTGAASRYQNGNPAFSKSSVVNRRLTDISRKNLSQVSTNFERNIGNQRLTSADSAGMKRSTNFGVHVRRQNLQPVHCKEQNKQSNWEECFPRVNAPKVFINSTEDDVNNKTDFSLEKICEGFSNIQDIDDTKEDENHFLQPDVEFVPDERYRNQILFGQGISPNVKPKQFMSSLSDRPSFFLKSKTALRNIEKLEEDGRRASMLRMSGLSLRPSQPSKCDPFQAVLRALENVDLEAEDRRFSTLKKNNPSHGSPRMHSKCDPIQAVLRALENVDLEAEDRRVSTLKNNPSYRSPRMQSPMFKQHVDPYKTALKRIEAMEMKKKAKSARKVTFNLESSVSNLKVSEQNEQSSMTSFKKVVSDDIFEEKKEPCSTSKPRETTPELQVAKNSSSKANKMGKNLSTTPELQVTTNSSSKVDKMERNLTQSHYYNMLLRVCDRICSPDKIKHPSSDRPVKLDDTSKPITPIIKTGLKTSESIGAHTNSSTEPVHEETWSSLYLQPRQPIQDRQVSALNLTNYTKGKCVRTLSNTTDKESSTTNLHPTTRISQISESVGPCFRTLSNRLVETVREDNRYSLYLPRKPLIEPSHEDTRYSLYLPRRPHQILGKQDPTRSTLSKLCTPRPISFFPKPGNEDSISPEFLCRRTSQIVAHAPISTPMVLRTMAANLEDSLSPRSGEESGQVCQRLDFDDEFEEKAVCETAQVSTGTPFKLNIFPIRGITTNQQILDKLADEECRAISSFTWLPEASQRNFFNPVANILTHGDDMHFVPLKLR